MTPKLFLLARPSFDGPYQGFLDHQLHPEDAIWEEHGKPTAAERIVEFAGRVCYMSFGHRQSPKTNAEYIKQLIRNGHESVLEHAVWTMALSGVSRAFTHQLVRHRVGFAFSQLSQQYHDESEPRFVRPAGIDRVPEAAAVWENAVQQAQSAYRQILTILAVRAASVPSDDRRESVRELRSVARSVLPNARETAVVVTANARALRHFLRVRGAVVGDIEMRCVASSLLETLRPEGPALFVDVRIEQLADGYPIVLHHSIDEICDEH